MIAEPTTFDLFNPDLAEDALLYHGTLRIHVERIQREGLLPTVGVFTLDHYSGSDMPPGVFASDIDGVSACHSAIGWHIHKTYGIDRQAAYEYTAIHEHGALLVIEGWARKMLWCPDDGSWSIELRKRYPQVEPGHYFHESVVPVTDVFVGDRLIEFLNAHTHRRLSPA